MLRTQSDARLVDLVRAGHASAFEAIVERYRKQLLAYCSRLLPASRAEDAVQQTFLKAYQAMISGDAELHLRPWLYRIAHNASLNLLRQNGWSHEQLDENMDGVQRPDQAVELRERLRSTVKAVKELPERQRDAVLLREVEGLSYEEIASALGVGDGAVRQLLHRARTTLRAGMTAVTPVGLVDRIAALAASGADPSARVAEAAAGIGLTAGAAKLGAAVLATGVIATGAVAVPIHKSHHKATRTTADETAASQSPGKASSSAPAAPTTQVDDHGGSGSSGSGKHGSGRRGSDDNGKGGHHHSSSGKDGGDDKGGERHAGSGSGGGDDSPSSEQHHSGRSGSGSGGSGSGHGGSGDGSGGDSHGGSSGSSGSGGSGGGHGSDDAAKAPEQKTESHHGGDDKQAVTVPTTTVPLPVMEDGSGKGKGAGSGSGSGSGSGGDD